MLLNLLGYFYYNNIIFFCFCFNIFENGFWHENGSISILSKLYESINLLKTFLELVLFQAFKQNGFCISSLELNLVIISQFQKSTLKSSNSFVRITPDTNIEPSDKIQHQVGKRWDIKLPHI